MEKITFDSFFNEVKKTIEEENIDIQIKNLIKKDDFNFNDYFESCSDAKEIIPILKTINKYFLKSCEIYIDDLEIYPIETEIYFVNDWFHDGMCHMNNLQKQHFGQLYFHRYKNSTTINLCRGGVDLCISDGNYYLSILIRSAFINGIFFSGITKIREKIITNIIRKETEKIDEEDIKKIKGKEAEIKLSCNRNKDICEQINIDNIFFQPRISGDKYTGAKKHELNCLNLGEKDEYLDNIISIGQTFYKKYKDSEEKEEYKKSLSRN